MTSTVIVAGARTPIGRLSGALATLSATDLGGVAIRGALRRAVVDPADVDYVIMGQVLQAGCGQITARQAAVKGGISMSVPALTINKVCLSGLDAIALADQLIRAGEFTTVVAGGMESMTNAPHLLPGSRAGFKYGDVTLRDHMAYDGLWDVFTDVAMGELTEVHNEAHDRGPQLTRVEQDAFAACSHRRAAAATSGGIFADEIEPVEITVRTSRMTVSSDEGIRPDTTVESLSRLRPAFRPDGTITAGSASQISDGAAAVVVMDKAEAERRGLTYLAEIGAHGVVAGPDSSLQLQPANAIRAAAAKAGVDPAGFDLYEINEAFAAVGISSARDLGISEDIVNVNGGAIALGHPIGMSGARMVLHLALELRRRGGGTGIAALCGGGGQGDALIVTAPRNR
jgi:acetyl-CoA C-acetyltransferase